MKVLLVNPHGRGTYYGVEHVRSTGGVAAYMPNLALATLAALTPDWVELVTVDETVEEIPLAEPWDVVGITGYASQAERMLQLADDLRRRGVTVVIGGPFASLSVDTVRPHCDVLVTGEAEHTWPQLLEDLRDGNHRDRYHDDRVDLTESPAPDISRMSSEQYAIGVVQSSRGCPFECEFCDVIVYLGRRQRYKRPDQVVGELRALHDAGFAAAFLADDNFTAHPGRVRPILEAIEELQASLERPLLLSTQLSIDVVRHPELLDLAARAGLHLAFVGLETSDPVALLEVRKRQNVREDLVQDVHALQRRGVLVIGGLIAGFDADGPDVFERHLAFARAAALACVQVTLLSAPEGTPLEARLRAAGRLRGSAHAVGAFDTNVDPLLLSRDELRRGVAWLLNRLFSAEGICERAEAVAELLPDREQRTGAAPPPAALTQDVVRAYRSLDGSYRSVPQHVARSLHGKEPGLIATVLLQARQAIGMLQEWGIHDPELAASEQPDLERPLRDEALGAPR